MGRPRRQLWLYPRPLDGPGSDPGGHHYPANQLSCLLHYSRHIRRIKTKNFPKMRKVLFSILFLTAFASVNNLYSQGCVAIRSTGGFCTVGGHSTIDSTSKWQFTVNNRYYKSFRHYVGTAEQKQRQTLG